MAHVDDTSIERVMVRRGRVDSFVTFDVTDSELQDLERGAPASLLLNFSIASLSVFATLVVTIVTVTIESATRYGAFVGSTIATGVVGIALGLYWWRTYTGISVIVTRIRARLPPARETVLVVPEKAPPGAEQSPDVP